MEEAGGKAPNGRVALARGVAPLRAAVARFRAAGESVALVPTMGALHAGHLALVRAGRALARRTIVSIFVNPAQFGPNEDFSRYPRTLESDLARLGEVGADLCFLPSVGEMYPPGHATRVVVEGLSEGLCGAVRPGHFAGVATVVTKLLLQALPDVALFGEKDFQQLRVIARAARDLDIPVAIEGVPTVREADGLALSSRNAFLDAGERAVAPALYRVLAGLAGPLAAGAEAGPLLAEGRDALLRAGFPRVDYLSLCDEETLAPVPRVVAPARLLAAAHLGATRLIDNLPVRPRPGEGP